MSTYVVSEMDAMPEGRNHKGDISSGTGRFCFYDYLVKDHFLEPVLDTGIPVGGLDLGIYFSFEAVGPTDNEIIS